MLLLYLFNKQNCNSNLSAYVLRFYQMKYLLTLNPETITYVEHLESVLVSFMFSAIL